MKRIKVLVIGPVPPPITGVGMTNQFLIEDLPLYFPELIVDFINTNADLLSGNVGKFSWGKIAYQAGMYRQTIKIFVNDKIYMTIGLTFWGVLKYTPYILLAKILKKEVIIHVHSDYLWQEYEKLRGITRLVFKVILSMVDKGIVLSPSLKRNLLPFLDAKDIFVVPNCVDNRLFEFDLSQKIENKFDKLRIVYLSNLMDEKGIFDLLEALRMLKEAKINYEACLAGFIENGLESRIENIVEMLAPETSYLGVVIGEEKKNILTNSNIFILPTYHSMEGQPISILEAMATGNIILTTEHAGIPDIFCDQINGYYIEKQNARSIFTILCKLQKNLDAQKIIALNNADEARKLYSEGIFIRNMERVFFK